MFSWRTAAAQKLHQSSLIAFMATGMIAGTISSLFVSYDFSHPSWLAAALVLSTVVFWRRNRWLSLCILAAGMLIGLWRGDSQLLRIEAYRPYLHHQVRLAGTINEDVAEGKHGAIQVQLRDIQIDGRHLPEKVWLNLRSTHKLKRSDKIEIDGTLKPGFGSFAASMSYAKIVNYRKGIDEARDIRDNFSRGVKRAISEPEASLGLGFLIGEGAVLPLEIDQQLRVAGLTHIVVASGYNLTILVRLARRLLTRVSKYLTAAFGFCMIGGFTLVTGLSPSMSRAGLVASLSLLAWYYGRKVSPFILLPFVAAITLLVNPSFAWGDIGWYLSFAAFAGVMILAPLLQDYFFGENKPGFVRQVLGETIAALAATAPIILLVFGQYSSYALLSNLLVVPLIPCIMLGVFLTGMTSLFLPFLASVASFMTTGLLHYVTSVVGWVASLPDAQVEAHIPAFGLALYYLLLI